MNPVRLPNPERSFLNWRQVLPTLFTLGAMLSGFLSILVAVQGIVILIAIIVAVVNFIVDVIAALVDPRVRY